MPDASSTEIEARLREALARADIVAPRAETFLQAWGSFSRPVAVRCDDGRDYVIKGRHLGRAVVNEQVVARLGVRLAAPVGQPSFVDVPSELIAIEPNLAHLSAGLAHATEFVPNCSDRAWIAHTDVPDNRARFASLAVLYGWAHAGDHQLVYANDPPHLVYSVDHGHFFPGGPEWTIAGLTIAGPAELEHQIVAGCALHPDEIEKALLALNRLDDAAVLAAVAAPPEDWSISLSERVALAQYLLRRRKELLSLLGVS